MSPLTATDSEDFLPWGSERLFDNGESYFAALIEDINSAADTINLETYIFDRDQVGNQVASALIDAHRRGVKVKVLMDAVGCYYTSEFYARLLESSGIEVKIFHPLPWQIHHYHRSPVGGTWLDKALYFFRRINQRDHRKLCLIDSRRLWSGSFNISANHLSQDNKGMGWRDYGLCVTGSVVDEIAHNFDALWQRGSIKLGRGLFKLYWNNLSNSARVRRNQLLLEHIENASDKIWIVSAYFAPALSVIKALRQARRRGIDVSIIVPGQSDIKLFPILTATYYADLLNAGISVYEYQPAMIHAKAVIIDDLHMIGSTNFNHRSFLHDLELDIQLHKPESKAQLQQWFRDDLANSKRVSLATSRHSLTSRLIGWFTRLVRYWA